MSFEGYYQTRCVNGHQLNVNCYMFDSNYKCEECGGMIIRSNLVDQTNGDDDGYDPSMEADYLFRAVDISSYNKLKKEVEYFHSQLQKAEEVLGFYATDASRSMSGIFSSYAVFVDDDAEEGRVGLDYILIKKGGLRARQYFKNKENRK